MSPFWTQLHAYCEAHSTPMPDVLFELERETHLKTLAPQMMSGRLQGRLLTMLAQVSQPRAALEIGAFTGYGAISIAMGLPEGSVLHTIEANPELEYLLRKYIDKAGLSHKIELHIGKAEEIIPALPTTFDFVFIDAGKQQYAFFYDLVFDRINPGGLLLADNVLWSGKVVNSESDPDTRLIQAFNDKVQQDPRVDNILLPLRDGLMLARKK
ncbi:MAG: O-methyltransferase [Saprospiraceae bacterium]|jgi:predicted O-methyltransferase YrrM|nr:O-methyltransferase [Saprospiraceae bacterium]